MVEKSLMHSEEEWKMQDMPFRANSAGLKQSAYPGTEMVWQRIMEHTTVFMLIGVIYGL